MTFTLKFGDAGRGGRPVRAERCELAGHVCKNSFLLSELGTSDRFIFGGATEKVRNGGEGSFDCFLKSSVRGMRGVTQGTIGAGLVSPNDVLPNSPPIRRGELGSMPG